MADFLHSTLTLNAGDVVEVTLANRANVLLLTDSNFDNYRSGRRFSYYGGQATVSPYRIAAPHAGQWHLVLDLGGRAGTIRHSFRVISAG